MAPSTFRRQHGQASVYAQPSAGDHVLRAMMALVSCPTASIGTVSTPDSERMSEAQRALPDRVADEVYHCGYHSESSFGAASYFIIRPSGNVLIDSPRFTKPLVRRLEDLGGVRIMFLTHKDDVADHARFRDHFECERILHVRDVGYGTRNVERKIEGDDPVPFDDELLVIPTPGHTAGSACLLYRDAFLFTGDHLAWSEPRGHIYGFRGACWFDWNELIRSTERLTRYRFEWILPGHGRRCYFPADDMPREMEKALHWMRCDGA
jgi:glyoxylase-like metal-dependent hydrolase (beta-lactamase superfamily II)